MSRRGKVRLISYAAAVMISLAAAIVACHVGAETYTMRLDAQSTRAFGEAYSAVSRLQRSLDACAYASDAPMQSALCTKLYADACAAETALSALPVELDALESLSRRISVAGDYAYLLSRTAAGGKKVSLEAMSALADFAESVHLLSEQLSDIREAFEQGDLIPESRNRLTDSLDNLEKEAQAAVGTLDAAFHEMAASFPETEPLVYDGQFSDHAGESPCMLRGKPIVSQNDAMEAAASFLHCDPSKLEAPDFKGGDIPCWRFSAPEQNAVVAVAVRGGAIAEYLSDCLEGGEADPDQAETIAKTFLAEHGYPDMEQIESKSSGSEVTMVFVPQTDDVLCLPDCVSVRVCTQSGQVTALDATDYLKHHTPRAFPETEHLWTPPESLSVESQRKAVLLSPGGQERLCTEYLCRNEKGDTVRVYVNAETGLQERILIGNEPMKIVD